MGKLSIVVPVRDLEDLVAGMALPDPGSGPSRGDPSHRSPEPQQGNSGFCSHAGAAGPMPPRAMSSPVVGRAAPRGTIGTYPGCSPTGGIFTGLRESFVEGTGLTLL